LDTPVESRASTRPSSLSRNGAGHTSLPTPHEVCDNKRQQQAPHQLNPCDRGNNRPTFWQVDPQHRPGSPTTQIRIAVICPYDCYLNFHISNLPHQLPAPDYLWDYTSSHDPIDMARDLGSIMLLTSGCRAIGVDREDRKLSRPLDTNEPRWSSMSCNSFPSRVNAT
jgi:hypothetical protein